MIKGSGAKRLTSKPFIWNKKLISSFYGVKTFNDRY
jgi:hypothetical protein